MKQPSVYIITNRHNTTLYIGVTSNLIKRICQHKNKLVYFEFFEDMENAITREKRLKVWKRDWKNRLINEMNPCWKNLYLDLTG
jgi:putative endonuclease